jgi:alpha-N-arabinofuranosidase
VLLARLQGSKIPANARGTLHTITAGLNDSASLEHPDAIASKSRQLEVARDISIELEPYSVAVAEFQSD